MINLKKLPLIFFNKVFSMFFLGILIITSMVFITGTKANAAQLSKLNNSELFSNTITNGQPILDSDGNAVSSANNYYIRVVDEKKPYNDYYFDDSYRGAYDWVCTAAKSHGSMKYTIDNPSPVEGSSYYFKDLHHDGYLKSYKPDSSYRVGGVYAGGQSGADQWYFNRKSVNGKTGYTMTSNRSGVDVYADTSKTMSLVVNKPKEGDNFIIIFEKA